VLPLQGGFEGRILWTGLMLYNRRLFWSFIKPRIIFTCLLLIVVGVGTKFILKTNKDWSMKTFSESATGPLQTRWGEEGLYREWCQFIHMVPRYKYVFKGYAEAKDALTNWVPRALNPKKTEPTIGLGFLFHADGHAYDFESPAPGLVGSVYADDELFSLTVDLFVVGLLLGLLRRYVARPSTPLQWLISYLCFALFQGLSAEAGNTTVIYAFLLTFGATGLAHLAVAALFKRKLEFVPPLRWEGGQVH